MKCIYNKITKKRKKRAAAKGESRRGKREVACVGTKWPLQRLAASLERDSEQTKAPAKGPENKK